MLISYNWLKEFIKLPSSIKIDQLARELSLKTVEVERFISLADNFNNIIVAEVLSVSKHEKADRLNIVELKTGKEKLKVVCGASNVASGQKVALALPGAILANGLEIKEVEIRGFLSKGMICAADELGLGDEHDGILVLDSKAKIGQSLAQHLDLDDHVLEIDNKSLSNRGDLWGHYGIARELSAIFSLELKPYDKFLEKVKTSTDEAIEVEVKEKDLCQRYCSLVIDNIKVEESPKWLKNRLLAAGLRPINNIVDISNYVMLELGQAMHAFDANKISNIRVELAKKGQQVELLDGDIKELNESDLLIKSEDKIIALAGIMGAKNSSISNDTKKIVLESANFDAVCIRNTASRLNKRTDSSVRFEKTIDPNLSILAIKRAAALIKKVLPGAKVSSVIVDINHSEVKNIKLSFSLKEIKSFLGINIKDFEVKKILLHLGFELEINDKKEFVVQVPSWRAVKDVSIKEDIFEEIIRIYGYDKVKAQAPLIEINRVENSLDLTWIKKIKNYLSSVSNMHEVYNYAFVGEKNLSKMNIDYNSHLKLLNPLSLNHNLLRQSLVPNIINNVINNQFNYNSFGLFEIGRVFLPVSGHYDKNNSIDKLPCQNKHLAVLVSDNERCPLLLLKGYLEALLKKVINHQLTIEYRVSEDYPSYLQAESHVNIFIENINLGYIGIISSDLNLKIKTAVSEIYINQVLELYNQFLDSKYQKASKYPALERDLAFVLDKKIMYNVIYNDILSFSNLINKVELFDVYTGDKLGSDLKSLAFHLEYQSTERTLTSAEVDKIQEELIEFMSQKHQAKLRDF